MFIADLHIHSQFSRATSRECVPEHLERWARRKGIDLVGTGDFTHPAWRAALEEKLEPAEEGFYRLRGQYRIADGANGSRAPRFVVTGEISSIYKKNGRVRKVHNLILLPGLEEAGRLAARLEQVGNLHSDGRPILGLDSRDLLEITLECCPQAVFIPAHIWTPHFSLFGAFSGFDTIEECFEDLTPYIHALETGLSSDPPMNWRLSALDRFTLVSNSDAHSPAKLGREANLLDCALSYPALCHALETREGFAGTLEFFPEEGKYHFDGHRNCGQCLKPSDTESLGGLCPVCGKKLTVGVLHRVEQLADREEGFVPPGAPRFESLVPLPEVIAASTGLSAAGVRVNERYEAMLAALGPEFSILREAPLEQIERAAGASVAEGIRRARCGRVTVSPGFDGEYGKIQLLSPEEISALNGQTSLFGLSPAPAAEKKQKSNPPAERREQKEKKRAAEPPAGPLDGLNPEQLAAVTAGERVVAVVAGPGTGKTKTLVSRIAWLVDSKGTAPAQITAVTFTNKAAGEMRARLEALFGKRRAKNFAIGTFHSLCLRRLEANGEVISLIDEAGALNFAAETAARFSLRVSPQKLVQAVSKIKNGMEDATLPQEAYAFYCARLREEGLCDFDDLLLRALALEAADGTPGGAHLLVDEFQDINALQYRLLQAWNRKSESLFVIGDPDQAIYGFRGADAHCFERLQADAPELREIRLIKNYRSTPEVLACAAGAIAPNPGPAGGRALQAQRPAGSRVRLIETRDEFAQGVFVAKEIARMVGGVDMLAAQDTRGEKPRSFGDCAVLYRTHRQAELLEKCLLHEGIPYQVGGRAGFLEDGTVRGAIAFFRSLLRPQDAAALQACLRLTFLIPKARASRLAEEGLRPGVPLPEANRQDEALCRWASAVEAFARRAAKEKPHKLLAAWAECMGLSQSAPFGKLCEMALLYPDMPALLSTLALGEEGDFMRNGGRAYHPEAVSLMTLHGAKGLEFPVVFLCGVQQGVLPLETPGRESDWEEERRLFYVGITRAKEELFVLAPQKPSPFVADLPAAFVQREEAGARAPAPAEQLCLF